MAEGMEPCSPCSTSQAEESGDLKQAEYALCRICHCEDTIDNLDSPCTCKGSLQFVHRKCLQKWISEKLDTNCEVCHSQYRGIGLHYTVDKKEPATTSYPPAFVGWVIPREGGSAIYNDDGTDRESSNDQQGMFRRPIFRIYLSFLLGVIVIHAVLIVMTRDDGDDGEASPIAFLVYNFLKALVLFIPVLIVARFVSFLSGWRRESESSIFLSSTNSYDMPERGDAAV